LVTVLAPNSGAVAHAEDRVDSTTTWYQERRKGNLGGLTVVHPQLDIGVDVGDNTTLDLGYSADAVSGATAAVYSTDAVSSATTFKDLRHAANTGITFYGTRSSLSLSGNIGTERDYNSIGVGVSAKIDLPGKNTSLALSYNHGFDQVCDFDNGLATALERRPLTGQQACKKRQFLRGEDTSGDSIWRDLSLDSSQATITQNLSPSVVAQIGLFGQVVRGFQSNPYRRVRVSGVEAQENIPTVRGRAALMARVNKYMPSMKSAIHAMFRGYTDTWGVNSVTLGLGYSQYFGTSLLLRTNARIYQQSEATFFKDAFFYETEGSAGEYFTGDRELGAIRNVVGSMKFSYIKFDENGGNVLGVFDEVSFNLKGEVYLLDELPADPIEDNREGIDRQFLSSGQAVDAFTLQLGMLFRY
tara:strand:+ start:57784 stop:59025 length:1242 start_codon:yes stop_codon:yes gene_type:complete